eukprot:m.138516 g.138516  ORF g.138516 m.138516 type:complete len:103 (-) comp17033_c0_seq2:1649-1957(-)
MVCALGMSATDVAFVGHLGVDELAGSSLAAIWMQICLTCIWGFSDALRVLCSQALGSGSPKMLGVWLQVSLLCLVSFHVSPTSSPHCVLCPNLPSTQGFRFF